MTSPHVASAKWTLVAEAFAPRELEFARRESGMDDQLTSTAFFHSLLSQAHEAHLSANNEALVSIYGFVEWALRQDEDELVNPASFFVLKSLRATFVGIEAARWIHPSRLGQLGDLALFHLGENGVKKIGSLLAELPDAAYQNSLSRAQDIERGLRQ